MSGIDAIDLRDETIMPLLLSKAFGLVKAQDRKISHKFCEEIGKLIEDKKYNDDIIIKTADAILADISEKDKSLKEAIMVELIDCYPDIKWNFKDQIQHSVITEYII